jgi:RimJ/RimL family protein N-acetyltransferase
MLDEIWPLFGLRLRIGDIELRLPGDEELGSLALLAARGIHDPDVMPFQQPWTDVPSPQQERNFLQFHWRCRAEWQPDSWHLPLTVWVDGRVAGSQGVLARQFPILREVETGSWLGREFQGRGIGKLMRAAVLHLAFAGLNAEHAITSAFTDNAASLGVTRALGYQPDGIRRQVVRDQARQARRFRISRPEWLGRKRAEVEISGLEPCLPLFGVT